MPQQQFNLPANLEINVSVPDRIDVGQITTTAQLRFNQPQAANERTWNNLPAWAWVVIGLLALALVAILFFGVSGSTESTVQSQSSGEVKTTPGLAEEIIQLKKEKRELDNKINKVQRTAKELHDQAQALTGNNQSNSDTPGATNPPASTPGQPTVTLRDTTSDKKLDEVLNIVKRTEGDLKNHRTEAGKYAARAVGERREIKKVVDNVQVSVDLIDADIATLKGQLTTAVEALKSNLNNAELAKQVTDLTKEIKRLQQQRKEKDGDNY